MPSPLSPPPSIPASWGFPYRSPRNTADTAVVAPPFFLVLWCKISLSAFCVYHGADLKEFDIQTTPNAVAMLEVSITGAFLGRGEGLLRWRCWYTPGSATSGDFTAAAPAPALCDYNYYADSRMHRAMYASQAFRTLRQLGYRLFYTSSFAPCFIALPCPVLSSISALS